MAKKKKTKGDGLRVLLYDLETSPNIVYTWGTHEQDAIKVIVPRRIICFAWMWLDEGVPHVLGLPDIPGYKKGSLDNRGLILRLHALFQEADVTVGHNVEQFDDRRSNTDFIKAGLKPPPPHRRVDTLKLARSKFDFNSNRLDDLGQELGCGRKVKHPGFPMWEGCLEGKRESWAQMRAYNLGDVVLLKKVYLKLRPWMTIHPNMNAADGNLGCPKCRSKRLSVHRRRMTQVGPKVQYECQDCGSYCTAQMHRPDRKSAVAHVKRFV